MYKHQHYIDFGEVNSMHVKKEKKEKNVLIDLN